jgi:hypothetical protein
MTKSTDELMTELTPEDYAYMRANWEGKQEQVFTHYEIATGITRHIHVTRLWQAINDGRLEVESRMMGIPEELYQHICEHQGIERSHLVNITLDDAAYEPALIVEFEGGDENDRHVLVDGNHKIVRAYEMGLRRRPALFIASTDLEPYLVHPPERVSALMVAATRANMQVKVVEPAPVCSKCKRELRPEPCPVHDADCPHIYV